MSTSDAASFIPANGERLPSVADPRGMSALSSPARAFALSALLVAIASALLAGWAPIGFSIATVFLFAGPHNWLEFRYFLTRLPARFGKLRGFFVLALAGTLGLTVAFIVLVCSTSLGWLDEEPAVLLFSSWDTLFVLWVLALAHLRSRQNPRRSWDWVWPLGFCFIALAWMAPAIWGLALVYLHPLMAFWLLDRELRRSRPEWRPTFHACLACLPVFLGLLWWRLAGAAPLPGDDELSQAIVQHAGSSVLNMVSSHFLVATHTFLEMLHYGVWVLAMPLIGLGTLPWNVATLPIARRSVPWRRGVLVFLAAGLAVTIVLWVGFVVDYTTTRNVYFTVALAHVLAEVPFLLRAL